LTNLPPNQKGLQKGRRLKPPRWALPCWHHWKGLQQCWCPQYLWTTWYLSWSWRKQLGSQGRCPWPQVQKWVRQRLLCWLQAMLWLGWRKGPQLVPQMGLPQRLPLVPLVPLVPLLVLLLLLGLRPLVLQRQRSQQAV